jgi:hypothetical protein
MAYGEAIGDPVIEQAASSGALHGGMACPSCAEQQMLRGVKNLTGVQ